MSKNELTPREREYLDCQTPMISGGNAAMRIIGGVFASLGQTLVAPSTAYNKTEKKLMRTAREIRYTRYKKAVLRKQNGTPAKKDEKLLKKLNEKDFVLAEDTYDPDEFTRQVYEEYMKNHSENGEQ